MSVCTLSDKIQQHVVRSGKKAHFGPQSEGRKFTGAITGAKVEERADKDEMEISSGVSGLYLQHSLNL